MPNRAVTLFAAAMLLAVPFAALANSLDNPSVPTGEGDSIFVIGDGGYLEPIGVRRHGKFINPGSIDGGPSDKLRMESNATLATNGNKVHVIFGGRVVATVPVKIANGAATIAVPSSLHLSDNVSALASPTLGGTAKSPRRAPTTAERTEALKLAANAVGAASPAKLTVVNLTALDLGRGTALVGTVNRRGSGTPRTDKRLFFIAERDAAGALRTTLTNVQTIKVTEPLLEEPRETLIDAIDLGDGSLSVVTRQIGYDAHTYVVYSRTGGGWKNVYSGGGAAM
ncbi:MAG TPA: hypothetical protein VGX96_20380 [Candidatus Elarobacter sp.]|jgi:hypothetical protein|nr:hypothetical protein [Candidatus Elarobacter sp.]